MQITLNHDEIIDAVTQYIADQGIKIKDKKTEVTMIAGRGTNGYSATVDIVEITDTDSEETSTPVIKDEFVDETVEESNETENTTDSLFGE